MKKQSKTKTKAKPKFVPATKDYRQNSTLLIFIPIIAAVFTFYYMFGSGFMTGLANRGNSRLVTEGWQAAQTSLSTEKPQYGTKFAYYKLQQGQDLAWAASHFSVNLKKLQQLNPGTAVWGTTIIMPPLEKPFTPVPAEQLGAGGTTVTQTQGTVYVNNRFVSPKASLTLPQLMDLTQSYGAITQLGPKTFLINKPLYVQNNIRLDITDATVTTLLLRSSPDFDITTLTFQSSEALIKGVRISSYDPATKKEDTNVADGRSFLRAYQNSRMDMIDSQAGYLGMTLAQIQDPAIRAKAPFISQGGVYGVSWRIGTGLYGSNIATGWVEKSNFTHNHIGAFTFGASGMMWRANLFDKNEVYGLDPHDDSNNATIEYNRFVANGKHGFIVSKRCNYNVIRNNIAVDNKLHGFMLHEDSNYNIIENNISVGNVDNFVIYGGSFNSVSNNKSYNPRGSHVRINQPSYQNYVTGNTFYGGKKGVYLYDGVNGVDISGNTFYNVRNQLTTSGVARILYANNQSNGLGYAIAGHDRVAFGINKINRKPGISLSPLESLKQAQGQNISLNDRAAAALRQN
jgi:parallel beta-helix repeat protein